MNYLKSEHILTDLNGIYNLLLFWETYSDIGDVDICFYQLTIIQAFVDASFNALIDDQETAIENFGLLSSSIPQVFIPIRGISKTMLPEILNTSILPYFERISEHYASLQVSFLCNLLLSIIISTNIPIKTSNEADANKIVNSISQLYTTVINVYKDHLSEEYIINSFILFLRHFSKCKYLSESSTISNKVYYQLSETTGIPSIMELLNFLFNSLWNLFYNITQPNLIYESSKALTTLFDPKSTFFTYVIKLPTVQQLIQIRVEKPFPFLQSFEHSRSRVIFHKSLSSILFRDMKVLCKQYLHTYDNIIENHTNLWCFLRDFTGFFEACKTIDEYKTIFNYVFNNHLAKLIEVIPHIIQISFVVNSLLKMWIVMLKNELINKCFDHHSINGLMLFHYSVDLITKLLDNLSDQIRLDNQQNIKFINYCLNIIYYIVASNYVPFNAIEIFNDDSLERLIVSFVKCITTVIPINEIKFYPKVELILQNLNLCFCIRHFNTVCKVNCNELSFIIIDVGLKSLNNKTQEKAINTLMYQIRNKKISAENKMLFTITFTLFDLILNLNGNTTELKFCLMEILRYFPICVQEIKNKIENAVIVEKREMFWNEFNGFVAACKEMFDSNNTTKFVEVIDNLMMHMRMCLSSVAYAFK